MYHYIFLKIAMGINLFTECCDIRIHPLFYYAFDVGHSFQVAYSTPGSCNSVHFNLEYSFGIWCIVAFCSSASANEPGRSIDLLDFGWKYFYAICLERL